MNINKKINIEFYNKLNSSYYYTNAEIINEEEKSNKIILTILVTYEWENINLTIDFEYKQTITKKDIIDSYHTYDWTIQFSPDGPGKFIKCNLNPNNKEDVCKILSLSEDTCSMGYELEDKWENILKNSDILDSFTKLVTKVTNKSYTDNKELLEDAENNNIINDAHYIYEDDYYLWEEIDKNLANTLLAKLQDYTKENFEPHDGDGLLDSAMDYLQIEFFET